VESKPAPLDHHTIVRHQRAEDRRPQVARKRDRMRSKWKLARFTPAGRGPTSRRTKMSAESEFETWLPRGDRVGPAGVPVRYRARGGEPNMNPFNGRTKDEQFKAWLATRGAAPRCPQRAVRGPVPVRGHHHGPPLRGDADRSGQVLGDRGHQRLRPPAPRRHRGRSSGAAGGIPAGRGSGGSAGMTEQSGSRRIEHEHPQAHALASTAPTAAKR